MKLKFKNQGFQDEPQSVDNTPKAKEAIRSLNPMCAAVFRNLSGKD